MSRITSAFTAAAVGTALAASLIPSAAANPSTPASGSTAPRVSTKAAGDTYAVYSAPTLSSPVIGNWRWPELSFLKTIVTGEGQWADVGYGWAYLGTGIPY